MGSPRGTPGGPPGDLVLLMNVSAFDTRGPPGGPRGAPAARFRPGGQFFVCLFSFVFVLLFLFPFNSRFFFNSSFFVILIRGLGKGMEKQSETPTL